MPPTQNQQRATNNKKLRRAQRNAELDREAAQLGVTRAELLAIRAAEGAAIREREEARQIKGGGHSYFARPVSVPDGQGYFSSWAREEHVW